jgi:hypothetical protein
MGLEIDVIYPGPDVLNEQQPFVCKFKRNRPDARGAPWR